MPVTTSMAFVAVVTLASSCHATTFTLFAWPATGESSVLPWQV